MAGPEDRMDAGEIEDRLMSAGSGDRVRLVVNGEVHEGEVDYAKNDSIRDGNASIGFTTDSGESIRVMAEVAPPEPNVGIPNPYIEEVKIEDGVLIDALQIWSDKYDDWL